MLTTSIFKIIPSELWEEAKLTGLIPRIEADIQDGYVQVCEFGGISQVCARLYQPNDRPIALEFSPDSYDSRLTWNDSTKTRPWREGQIKVNNLHADLVLNIYSFEYQQTDNGITYSLQGE